MGTETVKQLLCLAELVIYKFDNFFWRTMELHFIIQQKKPLVIKGHYNETI